MNNNKSYKILLDGKWSLEDLSNFSRIYFQNYSFLYCLETKAVNIASLHIENVLKSYELRHGLSYVNIYDIFKSKVNKKDKPQINSISYASPGWLDLALNADVALQFAKVMGIYLSAPIIAISAYKKLYKIYSDLSKLRQKKQNISLKLDSDKIKMTQDLNNELAKGLGFESLESLDKHTKNTEETSKLLMAHYRRITKMAKFVQDGKLSFPEKNEQ